MRGATLKVPPYIMGLIISIHAPHAGRDSVWRSDSLLCVRFQSTRPMRGATLVTRSCFLLVLFQSTRPMRGATAVLQAGLRFKRISIHAPHAGRDGRGLVAKQEDGMISIHAPHAGRDDDDFKSKATGEKISIHAPHAGRDDINK